MRISDWSSDVCSSDLILGDLVRASREGQIERRDVLNTAWLLLVAGHDTTANMIGLGMLTLLEHPDQLAQLQAEPALIPDAIEELLRYLTVVHLIILRIATEDIEIGGVTIPAGEGIIPLNFAANRDDGHFPDAAKFDIRRRPRDHVAFGYGVHQCIGQALARIELQIVFETLLRSEEHTSELQSLMRISYAVFCLKKKKTQQKNKMTSNTL